MDLNIQLNLSEKEHLYLQIYDYIRSEIRSGSLTAGERLPSTRSLASYLNISRSTTQLAYDMLAEEGYIELRRGSGAYVCEIADLLPPENSRPAAAVSSGSGQLRAAALSSATCLPPAVELPDVSASQPAKESGLIDFSPRSIDMRSFPYATWRRIVRGIMAYGNADVFTRGDPQGDLPLRRTIAHHLHLSRGVQCSPQQIVIGAGNDYLLMLLRQILGDSRKIAMENPTYLRAYHIFHSMEYEVVTVPMDSAGIDVRALSQTDCTLAYVMPAHQYPCGIRMSYPRRTELLQWAQSERGGQERYILEDDYDSEFKYTGRPVKSLQSLDSKGNVIYIGTFSKSIAPAIRISFMILPVRLLSRYHETCRYLSSTVSRIDQSILDEFIRDGFYERYLNRMRKIYKAKHDLALSLLAPCRSRFAVLGSGAGLHVLLRERTMLSGDETQKESAGRRDWPPGQNSRESRIIDRERELCREAAAAGIKIYPLYEQCIPGLPLPYDAPTWMIGYAALTEDEIRDGLRRLPGVCR